MHWDPPLYSQAMALSTVFLVVFFGLVLFYQKFLRHQEFATVRRAAAELPTDSDGEVAISRLGGLVGLDRRQHLSAAGDGVGRLLHEIFWDVSDCQQPFTIKHWIAVLGDPAFTSALQNSLIIGFGVASSAVVIYALLGYVILRTRFVGRPTLNLFVWIPWAIPGILIGLSLLWLFLNVPLLHFFYGTIFILIFALILKDMPIGTQMIKAAFSQVSLELEQASRVVGAGPFTTFRRITVPLVAPMIVCIFVLVFMSSVRDISTSILLSDALDNAAVGAHVRAVDCRGDRKSRGNRRDVELFGDRHGDGHASTRIPNR